MANRQDNNVTFSYFSLFFRSLVQSVGFLLKKLFGIHVGMGDYGHLVIEHSATLLVSCN